MALGVPTYKIILCGEYGVGKSSIFRRFLDNSFTVRSDRRSTVGLDQCSRTFSVNSTDVKLLLWDTGGMERMSFIGSSYYRGAHAALLCYSIANRETFSFLSQYVLDIVMNAEGAKIFLCGTMADCRGDNSVSDSEIECFVRECGDVLSGVYEISCKDNSGVMEMFMDIAKILHKDFEARMTLRRGVVLQVPNSNKDDIMKKKQKCSNCKI